MPIQPGVYNINNNHNEYAMMMYGNEEDGTPLTCIDGVNSQTQFNVKETGPGTNRYTIGSDTFKYNVGADPKNLTYAAVHMGDDRRVILILLQP
ncbi:hypothetical protein BN14_09986 [Rhizoctonia solani AG-1 IB]|uniref:Uncharacterized protein n=1 Tax=Thanatephorus cucumeris (strain AG1-IB / isolate 7/3/14) TaxID=1108050 RepID=M5C9W1_THACB|nr:hypothetical protein BN14_09986 [Rhizoctonia solani AG-1 IB]